MKIYLAAPYTHNDSKVVEYRVDKINEAAAQLINEGHFVFSPISHSHQMAINNDLPTDFIFWQKMNYSFIDWADIVFILMIDGYEESTGVKDEIEYCKKILKSYYYIS